MKPAKKPERTLFSSGPCAKRPGWSTATLDSALVGRSHRSVESKERLLEVSLKCRKILRIPNDWIIGIVPASDTGAIEMALWNLLGPLPVDVLVWESFGKTWEKDITNQLRIDDVNIINADYGKLPDLDLTSPNHDIVFTWNGTTSGVRVPDGNWISDDREGLTICDATSAAFAYDLPWEKLDVTTFSWQKVLGGEAQHGMIIIGPRAVKRLETHTPKWPLPKIFQLTNKNRLINNLFNGGTINTPSMLAVEDVLDALSWASDIGGLETLISRSLANLKIVSDWIDESDWASFLAIDPKFRSSTSICISISDKWFLNLEMQKQVLFIKHVVNLLETEGVAYDVSSYRDAPPGFRIWGGATVEKNDISVFLPWLDWAVSTIKRKMIK